LYVTPFSRSMRRASRQRWSNSAPPNAASERISGAQCGRTPPSGAYSSS
jgi:hypothetical protein